MMKIHAPFVTYVRKLVPQTLSKLSHYNILSQYLTLNSCSTCNKRKKTKIWNEMVLEDLGTKEGKIKIVIADGGFFAYDNYTASINQRVIPLIKSRSNCKEELRRRLENLPPNVMWFGIKGSNTVDKLLEEFEEIIQSTIEKVMNYNNYKKTRSKIELIFKIAKQIFGMKDLHVYYKRIFVGKAFVALYVSSLFYQFLEMNEINQNRAIALLAQTSDEW